jgi:condensin complex subunit 3
MALNSFQLFMSQLQSAPEVLKVQVLQIVFDILMVHEGDFLGKEGPQVWRIVQLSAGHLICPPWQGEMIVTFLIHILENEESEKVQALLCVGIAKLLLACMISDERVCGPSE